MVSSAPGSAASDELELVEVSDRRRGLWKQAVRARAHPRLVIAGKGRSRLWEEAVAWRAAVDGYGLGVDLGRHWQEAQSPHTHLGTIEFSDLPRTTDRRFARWYGQQTHSRDAQFDVVERLDLPAIALRSCLGLFFGKQAEASDGHLRRRIREQAQRSPGHLWCGVRQEARASPHHLGVVERGDLPPTEVSTSFRSVLGEEAVLSFCHGFTTLSSATRPTAWEHAADGR
jgi:hypothetical protein